MNRERLAHYRIISRLGAGGMGGVYRATAIDDALALRAKLLKSKTT